MRLFYLIQDFVLFIFLITSILVIILVFNPPSSDEMDRCEELNGEGFDYSACVIDRAL